MSDAPPPPDDAPLADVPLAERLRRIAARVAPAPPPDQPAPPDTPPAAPPVDRLVRAAEASWGIACALGIALAAAIATLLAPAVVFLLALWRSRRPASRAIVASPPPPAATPSLTLPESALDAPPDAAPPATLTRRTAWLASGAFLALIAIPPLVGDLRALTSPGGWLPAREFARALRSDAGSPPIAARLRSFESAVGDQEWTQPARRAAQAAVLTLTGRGNDRTVPGRDGWLFFRPELRGLTGHGPLRPEPTSVARDPALANWSPPLPAITAFAADLEAHGVTLLIVPIPVKAAIYPDRLTGRPAAAPVRHPDTDAFHAALRAAGIHVLDLAPVLWEARAADAAAGPVYLPQDTHWSPRGMAIAAAAIAATVQQLPLYASLPLDPDLATRRPVPLLSAPSHGDLVERLGLADPDRFFPRRPWAVASLPEGKLTDPESPVVLLGDSFVNIYDDPSLGFTPATDRRGHAGLARHLAWHLNLPLHVIAANGEGSTGVRERLMQLGAESLRRRRLVIWALAERDLLLPRSAAVRDRVVWHPTPVAATPVAPPAAADAAAVEAVVLAVSTPADPRRANYANALHVVRYRVTRRISGPEIPAELCVVHWSFRNRQPDPAASLREGDAVQLTLTPFAAHPDLESLNLEDAFDAPDPRWFSPVATPVAR